MTGVGRDISACKSIPPKRVNKFSAFFRSKLHSHAKRTENVHHFNMFLAEKETDAMLHYNTSKEVAFAVRNLRNKHRPDSIVMTLTPNSSVVSMPSKTSGDIHKRQVFDIPGGKKAYMIGSTIQQNFGEKVTKHGYGVYDIEKDQYDFVDLPNPKPFLSFYINSIDNLVDGTEKLVNY